MLSNQQKIKEVKELLKDCLKDSKKPLLTLEYDKKENILTINYLSLTTYSPLNEPKKYSYYHLVSTDLNRYKEAMPIYNRIVLIMADKIRHLQQDINML